MTVTVNGERPVSRTFQSKADAERSSKPIFKYQHHDWQRIFGLALSMTHAAEAVLLRSAELYVEYAKARTERTGQFLGLVRAVLIPVL